MDRRPDWRRDEACAGTALALGSVHCDREGRVESATDLHSEGTDLTAFDKGGGGSTGKESVSGFEVGCKGWQGELGGPVWGSLHATSILHETGDCDVTHLSRISLRLGLPGSRTSKATLHQPMEDPISYFPSATAP